MTESRDSVYIEHILECIEDVNRYYKSVENPLSEGMTYDAILRKLQIMSESTQRLSSAVKSSDLGVDWGQIAGFRNILVHDYLGDVDTEIVRIVIEEKLMPLQQAVKKIKETL